MIEALHLGSMLPATLGACCVAGSADRRSPLAWAGMVLMLAGMADRMLLPAPVLPALVWATALVGIALLTGLGARIGSRATARAGGTATSAGGSHMAVHRACQALLMAGLLLSSAGHGVAAPAGGHAGHAVLMPLLGAGAAGFAGFSAWLAFRRGALPQRGEAALGGLAVTAMAAATLI